MALHLHHGGQAPLATPGPATSSSPGPLWTFPDKLADIALDFDNHIGEYLEPAFQGGTPRTEADQRIIVLAEQDLEVPRLIAEEEPSFSPSVTEPLAPETINAFSGEDPMKAVKTKATIGVLSTLISYVSLNSLFRTLHPEAFVWQDEDREEAHWLATSKSWLDRKACRWLGLCGATHMHLVGPSFGKHVTDSNQSPFLDGENDWDWQNAWSEGRDRPEDWTDDERVLREIPEYILEYAPLVHLYSGEQFWPCDIAEHLYHVTPRLNYTPLQSRWRHPTLHDLDQLNQWEHGRYIFLTSNDNVEERPEWLEGEKNVPSILPNKTTGFAGAHSDGEAYCSRPADAKDEQEEWVDADIDSNYQSGSRPSPTREGVLIPTDTPEGEDFVPGNFPARDPVANDLRRRGSPPQPQGTTKGGRSDAPAVLVVVNKGHGIVDAFWFFFYSFNLGNSVFNVRFGNHVGDWEHSAVRFHHGKPKAVYVSEHNFGSAYSYRAVEKFGKRPVIYSAAGTHAMYATPGTHSYILPWGLLHDQTDWGPLWDPTLNVHAYTYDFKNDTLRSSILTPKAPTEWFFFNGHWGDKFYPLSDPRQYRFAGQYHYVNGPLGPRFKNLGRTKICGGSAAEPCVIKNWLGGSNRLRRWQGLGTGEEMSPEDERRFLGNETRLEHD